MTKKSNNNVIKFPVSARLSDQQEMDIRHHESLMAMHRILEVELEAVEQMQSSKPTNKDELAEWQEAWNKRFGAKETPLSVTTRIVKAMNKSFPPQGSGN